MPNPVLMTEELSRALIANLPDGAAFVVDRDLRYVLAEGEALATAGYKPEDFVGRTIFEVLSPNLAVGYEPMFRQALAGKPFEHEHPAHDRTYISRGTPLWAEDGEIYAVLVVSYDITDRKRIEDERKCTEERQAFLLKLGDILQRFVQPNDIKAAAMRLLGEYLGVSRAQYHECDSSGKYYSADGVGYANGLPLLDLKYRIDAFGTFVNEDFAAGRLYRSDDLTVDPRVSAEERDAYRSYQIRAGALVYR
ncbi:PAS domain-containing protein [Leptolyngbya ohadii]|uniref:PAS domain-containing protein n=1 Tax=Leptolyngbya ohadii TaxID=1962290 RepID=UPI001CEC012B|nr:PAS domain-containing protein [Leptolyngbya ohadii]